MLEVFPPPPTQEGAKIEKQAVIETLRARGFEDPDVIKLVTEWTIQEETKVRSFEGHQLHIAQALSETQRAELYIVVGDTEGVRNCFKHALYIARQEEDKRLYGEVVTIIDELGVGDLVFS